MPIIIDNLNPDDDSAIGTVTEYNPDTDADLLDAINADAELDGDTAATTDPAEEEGAGATAEQPKKKKRKAPILKSKGLTAKFFHRDLTGVGGKTGRLNKNVHPTNPDLSYQPVSDVYTPQSTDHKGVKTRYILTHPTPAAVLTESISNALHVSTMRRNNNVNITDAELAAWPYLYQLDIPQLDQMINVADICDYHFHGYNLWVDFTPQTIALRTGKAVLDDGTTASDNSTHIYYRVTVHVIAGQDHGSTLCDDQGNQVLDRDNNPISIPSINRIGAVNNLFEDNPLGFSSVNSFAHVEFSWDPATILVDMLNSLDSYLSNHIKIPASPTPIALDMTVLNEWSEKSYQLHERVVAQAKLINSNAITAHVGDVIKQNARNILWFTEQMNPSATDLSEIPISKKSMLPMSRQLRILEHYDVPLTAYSSLFWVVSAIKNQPMVQYLVRQNMQLTLSSNLDALNSIVSQLPVPDENVVAASGYQIQPHFSTQQREAITTNNPLAIIQAGAGTGKSTVILERIEYLCAAGTNPEEIAVLSFTNAAADNITAKNDKVTSMTISKMVHEIYAHNFPDHEISTIDTIINTLDIEYGDQMVTSDYMIQLRDLLYKVMTQGGNANLTALSIFMESHIEAFISVLSQIKQTSLELEIIICYLLLDKLVEPHASPKYLIIDEVQDNSVFEFVFALRFAAKHNTSLYLVGDSSQTLYEFRSANPKALNSLEASGVFGTYRLTTNYRSNQEILDFANIHLSDIEANQFAGIQLYANSFDAPTADSFKEKVELDMHHVSKQTEFTDSIPYFMQSNKGRFDSAILNNEQTIVLAHSGREIRAAQQALAEMYPNITVRNLQSDKGFNNTVFSTFIKDFWFEVTAVDPAHAAFTFTSQVTAHLDKLVRGKREQMEGRVIKAMATWWRENERDIQGWVQQTQSGMITHDEFFYRLRQCILDYEIRNNRARQSMLNARNNANKEAVAQEKPLLMVSTIHSAKGLEFDNVIVLQKPSSDAEMTEEGKRATYVALTRAKKRELIIAGSTRAFPRIVTDYEQIVDLLEERDAERKIKEEEAAALALLEAEQEARARAAAEAQAQDLLLEHNPWLRDLSDEEVTALTAQEIINNVEAALQIEEDEEEARALAAAEPAIQQYLSQFAFDEFPDDDSVANTVVHVAPQPILRQAVPADVTAQSSTAPVAPVVADLEVTTVAADPVEPTVIAAQPEVDDNLVYSTSTPNSHSDVTAVNSDTSENAAVNPVLSDIEALRAIFNNQD